MNYVMSDLHGCYDEFILMLELIKFSADDTLIIIGDVVDRGPSSVKLLRNIMARRNVRLLMGNHEYKMSRVLNAFPVDVTADNFREYFGESTNELLFDPVFLDYCYWMDNGGESTFAEYLRLPLSERHDIINFLNGLAYYYELSVKNQKYLLSHSVSNGFIKEKPIENYEPHDWLFHRIRPERWHEGFYDDKIIIVGHTPTWYIDRSYAGKIYKNDGIINIDCGCVYKNKGGRLCFLRLDDIKEYYV